MIDKLLAWIKDGHMPAFVFVFITGAAMQWFKHLDPTFVAYTGTVLGAITGHAWANKDQNQDK